MKEMEAAIEGLTREDGTRPLLIAVTQLTSTIEERGYGWCFAHWYGPYGVAFSMPAIANTVYEQVGEYPYYIDQTMRGWFREINGVS